MNDWKDWQLLTRKIKVLCVFGRIIRSEYPENFKKFAAEVVPYTARDDFAWQEHPIFITQDENRCVFWLVAGPYSDGRLSTYSFYLLNEDDKARTDFIKGKIWCGRSESCFEWCR